VPCAGHQDGIALRSCSRCAVPGCADCLEQVNNVFYCTDCLVQRLQAAEFDAYDIETKTAARGAELEAMRRIRRNWILAGVSCLVGVASVMASLVTEDSGIPTFLKPFVALAAGIVAGYLVWSALWGIPAAWTWWKGLFEGFSALILSSAFGWLLLAVSFFVIPVYFGYLYGVFGGAINEYRKNRRILAGTLSADSA
jgi:hypothetical protein